MSIKSILKWLRVFIISVATIFVFLLLAINLPPGQRLITSRLNSYFQSSRIPIHVEKINLLVTGRVGVQQISILQENNDTIVYIHKLKISLRPFPLLFNKIYISTLNLNGAVIHLATDSITHRLNLLSVFPQKNVPPAEDKQESGAWKIQLAHAGIRDISFSFDQPENSQRINVSLHRGKISDGRFDMARQMVHVGSLELLHPDVTLFSATAAPEEISAAAADTLVSFPGAWIISADHFRLHHGNFRKDNYEKGGVKENTGNVPFLDDLNITLGNLFLSSEKSALNIRRISFGLANGVQLKKGSMDLKSNPSSTTLELDLNSQQSRLAFEFKAGTGLPEIISSPATAPFTLTLKKAEFAVVELSAFMPASPERMVQPEKETGQLSIKGMLSGSLDSLHIGSFNINAFNGTELSVNGFISGLSDPASASCNIFFRSGEVSHTRLKQILQFSGIDAELPYFEPTVIQGNISEKFSAPEFDIRLQGGSGNLKIRGSIDISKQLYSFNGLFENIEAGKIAGVDTLDRLSGNFSIQGAGFVPEKISAAVTLEIDSVGYGGYSYKNINLGVQAKDGNADFTLISSDEAFRCDLAGSLSMSDSLIDSQVSGRLHLLPDLMKMVPDPMQLDVFITARFLKSPEDMTLSADLEDLILSRNGRTEALDLTSVRFHTTDRFMQGKLESDFIKAGIESRASFNQVKEAVSRLRSSGITFPDSAITFKLPILADISDLTVSLETTYDPFLTLLIPDSIFVYHRADLYISRVNNGAISGDADIDRYSFRNLTGYNLRVRLLSEPDGTTFHMAMDSIKAGNVLLGSSGLDLSFSEDRADVTLKIADRSDRTLYEIASGIYKRDDQFVLQSSLPQWTLNGSGWSVSSGDLLILDAAFDDFTADLTLSDNRTFVRFSGRKSDKLVLECNDVLLSSLLDPEMTRYRYDGILSGKAEVYMKDLTKLDAQLEIAQLKQDDQLLGILNIEGSYVSDSLGMISGDIRAELNDTSTIRFNAGERNSKMQSAFRLALAKIPLYLLDPFVDEYLSGLTGYVSGELTVINPGQKYQLDGSIRLNNTKFTIILLNEQFSIPEDEIVIRNNRILFNRFMIADKLERQLFVNGSVNVDDPANILADIRVTAENIRLMHTTPADNPAFNGTIYVNSELQITGPVSEPSITGKLALADGSVINYRHMDNLNISEAEKTILFAGYSEADSLYRDASATVSGSPTVKASIEINRNTRFNFQISQGYDIDAGITGGGFLNYTLLPNNTTDLSGTYEIQEGKAGLKIIGFPRKEFDISSGSYLRWDGEIDDPELNIETTNKVRGTYLNPVDQATREVDFMVNMKLSNRLSQLDIVFDVISTDQYIMSVLNSQSEDERMRQAVNLLVFERIELPGVLGSSDYLSGQINRFWESQLNQFSKTTFKNVDIAFGIDTYQRASEGGAEQEYTSFTYEVKKEMFSDRVSVKVSGRMNDNSPASDGSYKGIENFTLEYSLDSSRTHFLKVYRQQNYEDLLEGEVTKSGVGYLFRRNYHKLSDIWQRKKRKTTNSR